MTEQERFESAMRQKFGDLVNLRTCINNDDNYMAWDTQVAWFAWQSATAQAMPEGYVVVPDGRVLISTECSDDMAEAIAFSVPCCGGIAGDVYEAIITVAIKEALENK